MCERLCFILFVYIYSAIRSVCPITLVPLWAPQKARLAELEPRAVQLQKGVESLTKIKAELELATETASKKCADEVAFRRSEAASAKAEAAEARQARDKAEVAFRTVCLDHDQVIHNILLFCKYVS